MSPITNTLDLQCRIPWNWDRNNRFNPDRVLLRRSWQHETDLQTNLAKRSPNAIGLNDSAIWTSNPRCYHIWKKNPWWYLTSPDVLTSFLPSKHQSNKSLGFCLTYFINTFRTDHGSHTNNNFFLHPVHQKRWISSFTNWNQLPSHPSSQNVFCSWITN